MYQHGAGRQSKQEAAMEIDSGIDLGSKRTTMCALDKLRQVLRPV